MFPEPVGVPLQAYARLPEELRVRGGTSRWAQRNHGIRTLPSFLEGPVVDADGVVWCVDLAWGRVFRVDADGSFTVALEYDGEPNGLALHSDGRLFVADRRHGLLAIEGLSGSPTVNPILQNYGGEPFKGLNDLVFGTDGTLYFTDQGSSGLQDASGRVFSRSTGGETRVLLDNVPSPNGLVVDASGSTVFVAVTRDNAVWRAPVMADGSVTKVGRFVQLSGGVGPDGLALDAEGRLLVAHLGVGVVWLFDARGVPIGYLYPPSGSSPTNVTFVPGTAQVIVTESETGCLLTADLSEHALDIAWPRDNG